MVVSGFPPIRMSRSRVIASAGSGLLALGLLAYFWTDLCLWRADVQLQERRHEAAGGGVDLERAIHAKYLADGGPQGTK